APSASTTQTAPRWALSTSAPRNTSTSTGLFMARPKADSGGAAPRLAPALAIDDIGERAAAERPEFAHGVDDRENGVGVDAGRQPERGLGLLLVEQMAGGERRAEPERACGEQHVLHGRIDARAGGTVGLLAAVLDAGDDPHRGLVKVLGEILGGIGGA